MCLKLGLIGRKVKKKAAQGYDFILILYAKKGFLINFVAA